MKKIITIIGGLFLLSASITPVLAFDNQFNPHEALNAAPQVTVMKVASVGMQSETKPIKTTTKENIMKKYLATVFALGTLAFSASIPLASAQAKEVSAMGLASTSDLPACPSLFRCVVK